jgi:hypothetical protein
MGAPTRFDHGLVVITRQRLPAAKEAARGAAVTVVGIAEVLQ